LDALVGAGLTQTEASVYLEMLKYGETGTRVFDLLKSIEKLNRTTLYSILTKMESSGIVLVSESSSTPRNARLYSAIPPMQLLQRKIEDLQSEIERLKGLEPIFKTNLNDVYIHGASIGLDAINDAIRPYIAPLLDNLGWKIKSVVQEEHLPVFNYSVYDVVLQVDKFIFLDEIPFHLFVFDENIEYNDQLMQIMIRGITSESKRYISAYLGNIPYEIHEMRCQVLGHELPAFQIRMKKADLEPFVITPMLRYYGVSDLDELPGEVECTFGVAITFKNRMFYVWAESRELIEQAIAPIFSIEEAAGLSSS
jgi:predicted transcriptional regulator